MFARRSGLTASALRFYADAELLLPAEVDPVTGYRFYREEQLSRAVMLRQLREIAMSLATVKSVLGAEREEAVRLVDEHIDAVVSGAEAARQQASVIKATLAAPPSRLIATLSGPVLASAIEQILTATTNDPDIAVLGGVRFEAQSGALTVTATDRYRLSTRTLPGFNPLSVDWAATVNGDDLHTCLADLRRIPVARIEATEHEMWMRGPDSGDRQCRLLPEPFPDYRSMLDALPAVTTRVEASKVALLHALERRPAHFVSLHITENAITVHGHDGPDTGQKMPARVNGTAINLWFEMTTLYPAISTAIGSDVLLDLRGPAQPATVRSADHGDLTTLVMPAAAPPRVRPTTKEKDECQNPPTPTQ